MNTATTVAMKKLALFQYEKPCSYTRCRRRRGVHANEYENAVRNNRVFHVSLISRGKRWLNIRMCSSLSFSTNTSKALRCLFFAYCKFV